MHANGVFPQVASAESQGQAHAEHLEETLLGRHARHGGRWHDQRGSPSEVVSSSVRSW